jgi:DNA-binding beta-propeller fold protein YncE
MKNALFAGVAILALGIGGTSVPALSQRSSPPSPGFVLQKQSPSANIAEMGGGPGRALEACGDELIKYCVGLEGGGRTCLEKNKDKLSSQCKATVAGLPEGRGEIGGGPSVVPHCSHSPLCSTNRGGGKPTVERVEWNQTKGYTFAYPFALPSDAKGGVSGVAADSKGNLWAFQRNAPGQPQLFEFDSAHKLIRTIPESEIGHIFKAHGIAVDAEDNVWICDADGSVVMKLSPEGKLLMTLGTRRKRGDWVEDKGQRLLWQPMDIAFGPHGDIYIAEGHADESPNDTDSEDPANMIGAARVLHLDKNARFINQWYGNAWGPGKFESVHGIGVDPKNGNVWLGDRDQYRLVVYSSAGKFIKTLSMKNLTCAVHFDSAGNLWVATGNDGQLINIDQYGNVLGAVGNGRGTGNGQFMETNFIAVDAQENLYTGDTTVPRITEMVAHK